MPQAFSRLDHLPTSVVDVLPAPNFSKSCAPLVDRTHKNESTMQKLRRVARNTDRIVTSCRPTVFTSQSKFSPSNPQTQASRSRRDFSASKMIQDPFKPARRVAGQRKDVWYLSPICASEDCVSYASIRSIVNEAAEASSVKPMVNMGQGFFGYNRTSHSTKLDKRHSWV